MACWWLLVASQLARRICPPKLGRIVVVLASCAAIEAAFAQSKPDTPIGPVGTVRVDVTPEHAINSFDPDSALGSSIDVLSRSGIDRVFTPHIIQESLSAGWGPITYRNNTELRMAAWHWTENGTWSDAAHRSGYFTAARSLRSRSNTFLPTHCRIVVSRPAAIVRYRGPISATGKAIPISPASSLARAMPCTHSGWWWT